jgi:hypothetical protein
MTTARTSIFNTVLRHIIFILPRSTIDAGCPGTFSGAHNHGREPAPSFEISGRPLDREISIFILQIMLDEKAGKTATKCEEAFDRVLHFAKG